MYCLCLFRIETNIETMKPTFQFLLVIFMYTTEQICCSGPDFSDVRYLANNGYELPSQALYKKIYGGHGKRYGVHFPGLLSSVMITYNLVPLFMCLMAHFHQRRGDSDSDP